MAAGRSGTPLSFVWQPQEISLAVMELARETGTRAIFDVSFTPLHQAASLLRAAQAQEVKVPAKALLDTTLEDFLRETGIDTLWVEYHPALGHLEFADLVERLDHLKSTYTCIPVTGDWETLEKFWRLPKPPRALALKGNEAAGWVSTESIGILYAMARATLGPPDNGPDLIIWGGIATPEAAAAFLATGAAGIVFESLHWQTDLVSGDEGLHQRLARLKPDHTTTLGAALGVPCRVFDKGNSLAVKELRNYEASLGRGEISTQERQAFVRRVMETATPALESDLGRQDLVFLGPEAAFAPALAERFGRSSQAAVAGLAAEVHRLWQEATAAQDCWRHSPLARELGTVYPFIQGAMTWISDVPQFALAVAEAGGLPTVALGLRSREQLDRDLGGLPQVMGPQPYAVNFMALPENPFLEEQLAWIRDTQPPLAVVAAGEPSYAVRLMQEGIRTIYIAPDEGLLRLALEAGVRYVILEGNEAGGHVGALSTLTLAQMALELKRQEPKWFHNCRLVLAGGIFNRETAFRAAMLGADGVQMGTAYLATREIVATGALSPLYQRLILQAGPGATTVSGETIGLRVRSLRTAKMEAIVNLEKEFAQGQWDEASFRRQLESLSAKSLLMAARGVEHPEGPALGEEICLREGQFMSGAAAGAIQEAVSVAELHRNLAEGPLTLAQPHATPVSAPAILRRGGSGPGRERVAITGMALVNSLGNSPREIWQATLALKSGITDVPLSRWDHRLFYDPDPRAPEKTYCKVGAFSNFSISRKELGIPPQDFRTMAESTKLTMWLAHQAITESGILQADIPRERIGVLISQNSGESASTLGDLVVGVSAKKIVHSLRNLISLTPDLELLMEQEIKQGLIRVDDTTLLGRLNCTAGGFICNKYGFMGPSFSVSAACATFLVALYTTLQMIKTGVLDAAVVGGGEELLSPAHFLEFSALGALAGISGVEVPPHEASRPFDITRDGMVLGEGGGIIVIERESVAKQRGAPIYAYITGAGASNSDQGMVESLAATQEIAIRAAFADVDYGPDRVDLVECHATSTMQGDGEEVKALKAFFPQGRATALTSFKSQIGHTLGASGINSLIRGVLAMEDGIYPPSLNYRRPDPEIDLESWGFYVPAQPLDWPRPPGQPRRLMVNAFGFGGANYVVHLEECLDGREVVLVSPPEQGRTDAPASVSQESQTEVQGVSFFATRIADQSYRLAVEAADEAQARAKVAALEPLQGSGTRLAKEFRALERQGIFAGPAGAAPPPLALVFAGQGTYYPGMGRELYETFPVIREWMERIAGVADFDILNLLFHSREEDLRKTLWQQPALFTLEYAMGRHLLALGVRPAAMAGHSLGELVALCLAGVFSFADGFLIVNKRAQCMDKASTLSQDPGIMMAVNVPLELLTEKISRSSQVFFTNYNSPRQVVLGGATQAVLALKEELDREGYWTYPLKVSMAFHSPIMQVIHDEMQAFLDGLEFHPPRIPVISNTTQEPFPDDPLEIKKIIMAHLESPVHWMQNVQTLWDDHGVRCFVEVGPKDTLCNLIGETIETARCLPTCDPEDEALTYRTAVAMLYAQGYLKLAKAPPQVALPSSAVAIPTAPPKSTNTPGPDRIAAIVQREITAFMLESFGRFLKPAILEAIRREVDPSFTEASLEGWWRSALPGVAPGPVEAVSRVQALAPLEPVASTTISPVPPPAPPAAVPEAGAIPAPVPAEGGYLEPIIQIIIAATGYERDEIEADMDLRQDLAIRSSRLPVIMDAAERQFGITIRLEDFIGVRTVQELADRVAEVVARDGAVEAEDGRVEGTPLAPAQTAPLASPAEAELQVPAEPLKRLVLREAPLEVPTAKTLSLKPGQLVAVLSLGDDSPLYRDITQYVEQELQGRSWRLNILGQTGEQEGYDLCTPEGAAVLAGRIMETPGLAGLILAMGREAEQAIRDLGQVPALLSGLFSILQSLMRSQDRKFCLLLQRGLDEAAPAMVLCEGVLGTMLAAAQEYSSVLFRSLGLDSDTDVTSALNLALNPDLPLIQVRYRGAVPYTVQVQVQPAVWRDEPALHLAPGDVVLISGGARGITAHLARSLAPLQLRLVLLGRTDPEPGVDYERLLQSCGLSEEAVRQRVKEQHPELTGDRIEAQVSRTMAGLEITQTLAELARLGAEAAYFSCDVTDRDRVAQVVAQVAEGYGRIDGLIHGAGMLRDTFMEFMTPKDFAQVVDVKVAGCLNLYQTARIHGLRFMVGLSSLAAVLGNAGQANYCAGNRAMTALLEGAAAGSQTIKCKVLALPPIEGTGMADDPEMKELLKLKGLEHAYLHVSELSELFCHELLLAPADQTQVVLARVIPPLKTTLVDVSAEPPAGTHLTVAGMAFTPRDFPMIDTVTRFDYRQGKLEGGRTFAPENDIWIKDHRPFKFLKHPLVSGIMAVEIFMETASLLFPHLRVLGLRQMVYENILECPPGVPRETRIFCRRDGISAGEVLCQVALASRDLSPSGRPLDSWSPHYQGQIILGASVPPLGELPGFPVNSGELDTRPASPEEVRQWYEDRTSMQGRYRVLETLDGTGPDCITGTMIYRGWEDFAGRGQVNYRYSPYLLEGLLHLTNFFLVMHDEAETRKMIPAAVEEMRFTRLCGIGEILRLEGRRRATDAKGSIWDAQARDEEGNLIMQAHGLLMKWFGD